MPLPVRRVASLTAARAPSPSPAQQVGWFGTTAARRRPAPSSTPSRGPLHAVDPGSLPRDDSLVLAVDLTGKRAPGRQGRGRARLWLAIARALAETGPPGRSRPGRPCSRPSRCTWRAASSTARCGCAAARGSRSPRSTRSTPATTGSTTSRPTSRTIAATGLRRLHRRRPRSRRRGERRRRHRRAQPHQRPRPRGPAAAAPDLARRLPRRDLDLGVLARCAAPATRPDLPTGSSFLALSYLAAKRVISATAVAGPPPGPRSSPTRAGSPTRPVAAGATASTSSRPARTPRGLPRRSDRSSG